MLLKISHQTTYRYEEPVHYALQQLRLTPKSRANQNVKSWETMIQGGRKEASFEDQHANLVELVSFEPGRQEIAVTCTGEVETTDTAGIIGEHGGFAPLWYFKRPTDLTRPGAGIRAMVDDLGASFDDDIARMHALTGRIIGAVTYETGKTHSETTAEAALTAGHGVCQDHAQIFISAARLMDFPARYVSGYLMMDDVVDQDASHAWAEVHIEGIGWIGFDVSNGICPDARYVRVATGLDYKDAAPFSGMRFGDAVESMIVSLQVQQ